MYIQYELLHIVFPDIGSFISKEEFVTLNSTAIPV